jgi:hypothetical protein
MSDYRAGSFVCCAAGCDRPKGHISHCSINVDFGVGLAEWGSKSTFALQDSESHMSALQTRSFGDVGPMSGLPESGHDSTIYEYNVLGVGDHAR